MRISAFTTFILLAGCTTKQDVLSQPAMLDRVFSGDYREAAVCIHNGIQTGDYTIQPFVAFIPGLDFVEIQTTATSGMTGTIFGQITRVEKVNDDRFRVVTRAAYTADGDVAVAAVVECTGG